MAIFVFWIVFAIAAGFYAEKKGRSGAGVFLLSLLLSPLIGFIVAACMKTNEGKLASESGMKKCPACAEFVKGDAQICRYCRNPLTAGVVQAAAR